MGGWEKIADRTIDRTIAKQKKWPNGIEDPLGGPCAESAMEKLPPGRRQIRLRPATGGYATVTYNNQT